MKRDYGNLIIGSALLVTMARYIGAFVASDAGEITGGWSTVLTILMAISGIGMGALDVAGLAYVFEGWRKALPARDHKPSARFLVLSGFVVISLFVSVSILVPYTVSRITQTGMKDTITGGWLWAWSVAVNLAPLLLIGGVMVSQTATNLTDGKQPESSKVSGKLPESKRKVSASFRRLPEDDRIIIGTMKPAEIAKRYNVSERTARNWKNNASRGNQ